MTTQKPEYIRLDSDLAGNQYILIDQAKYKNAWPTEPRHDYLTLACNIGDTLFLSTRTIEIVFYDFNFAEA